MRTKKVRVILAAQEADLRLASQLLLTEEPNVDVVGSASTVNGLLALLKTYQVDIVILDSELSARQTSEWITKIKNSKSKPEVILLSHQDLHQQAATEIGVDIIVNKMEPPEYLISAFRRLVAERNSETNQDKENIES